MGVFKTVYTNFAVIGKSIMSRFSKKKVNNLGNPVVTVVKPAPPTTSTVNETPYISEVERKNLKEEMATAEKHKDMEKLASKFAKKLSESASQSHKTARCRVPSQYDIEDARSIAVAAAIFSNYSVKFRIRRIKENLYIVFMFKMNEDGSYRTKRE